MEPPSRTDQCVNLEQHKIYIKALFILEHNLISCKSVLVGCVYMCNSRQQSVAVLDVCESQGV